MKDERTNCDLAINLPFENRVNHYDCRPNQYPTIVYKRDSTPRFNHFCCDKCEFIASFTIEWLNNSLVLQKDIADLYLCQNSILVRTGNEESEYWSSNPYWSAFHGWISDANRTKEISVVLFALNEGFIKLNIIKGDKHE